MSVWHLVWREMLHRKLGFALAVLAAAVAAGVVVCVLRLMAEHDAQTSQMLAQYREQVESSGRTLEDDTRRITKGLGFNVLILPKHQSAADIYSSNYASVMMSEGHVERLAKSPVVTIEHLLPALEQSVVWPERQRRIILVGIRGEVPFAHKDAKQPIVEPVKEGEVILGYELAALFGLNAGDTARLMGREFRVAKTYPFRGGKDDITVWIDLKAAQQMLGKPGLINCIWALNCNCASKNMLGDVREEIAEHLPDVDVRMLDHASIRADARINAHRKAMGDLAAAEEHRARMRRQLESLAAILVPLVILVSGAWIGLLALGNVRERLVEIGILRALGLRTAQILKVFLLKAALVGLIGAAIGSVAGWLAGAAWSGAGAFGSEGWMWPTVAAVVLAAPLLSVLASWLPAVEAARQEPAAVLREE